MLSDARCPCGSGDRYAACCGAFHSGAASAPTALALMRSRFSAYAVGAADYLTATWHRETRPRTVELDDAVTWRRLQIVDTEGGGPDDTEGVVEFRASYQHDDAFRVLHERSRFTRDAGRWVYVDGDIED